MIVKYDTADNVIHYNDKKIDINPTHAFAMAPKGTVIEVLDNDGVLVTLKLTIPND